MKLICLITIAMAFLFTALPSDARLLHNERVQRDIEQLRRQQQSIMESAENVYESLKERGIETPSIFNVVRVIEKMNQDKAWDDLEARDTRRHQRAKERPSQYIPIARQHLAISRKQLNEARRAEREEEKARHEAWARKNPEAAREAEQQLREIEIRSQHGKIYTHGGNTERGMSIKGPQNNAVVQNKRQATQMRRDLESQADMAESVARQLRFQADNEKMYLRQKHTITHDERERFRRSDSHATQAESAASMLRYEIENAP